MTEGKRRKYSERIGGEVIKGEIEWEVGTLEELKEKKEKEK